MANIETANAHLAIYPRNILNSHDSVSTKLESQADIMS